jgi:hypothetical protein
MTVADVHLFLEIASYICLGYAVITMVFVALFGGK